MKFVEEIVTAETVDYDCSDQEINHNVSTAQSHYAHVHTTHTYATQTHTNACTNYNRHIYTRYTHIHYTCGVLGFCLPIYCIENNTILLFVMVTALLDWLAVLLEYFDLL